MTKTISNNQLQIGLVSTRRPDLLEITLSSFTRNLFNNFQITHCFANIDPAFGDKDAHQLARECINDYLPNVIIREPAEASFGGAVKWVWGQFKSGLALHLEDDWELLQNVEPNDVYDKLQPGYSAVTLCGNHHKWYKRRPYVWVGAKQDRFPYIGHQKLPFLGTAPKFIDADFANTISHMLDPELDPEKQMLPSINPAFMELFRENKCSILDKSGYRPHGVMRDLGRDWRSQRGIKKLVINGKSEWSK